ncbi:MAG: hypothetical protein Q7S74_06640 [Nanoarchaeota archaeon]|nr:hypothetical protein [Nanoarchaeota archaeon]
MSNKVRFFAYWIVSLVWVVLFGEIIGPLIARHELVIFRSLQFFVVFMFYYALLTLIFTFIVRKFSIKLSLIVFFVYGVLSEMLLFGNIHGYLDILGILFFGFFYVFLFGVPIWLARKFNIQ